MPFINQYSFVIVAIAMVALLVFYLFRRGFEMSHLTLIGALILGLVIAFMILRPGDSTTHNSQELLDQIGSGQAVLLEFQSNY